jgi:hypothetical protein
MFIELMGALTVTIWLLCGEYSGLNWIILSINHSVINFDLSVSTNDFGGWDSYARVSSRKLAVILPAISVVTG